jgi:Transglutaminase-like superfamily
MLGDRLIHLVARLALVLGPPARAKRIVDAIACLWPPLSVGEAMRTAQEIESAGGTCLTRALAVAARVPGAHVVLGSDAPGGRPFAAHAWVERDGVLISASTPSRYEIARLG